MSDISKAAREFMGAFFWAGMKSSVTSHEPHTVLSKHQVAFDECKAAGLITVEPFNRFGSITIKPTTQGAEVAESSYRERAREMFPEPAKQEGE